MEAISIKNYSFTYALGTSPALSDINLTINDGEFVIVCGPSGCGKTTLLRALKPQLRPNGKSEGTIDFYGSPLYDLPEQSSAAVIGYVMQNPDAQIVTDKVWHELAFALENQNVPTNIIRSRVAEMANYFGIHNWFRRSTSGLSGGQKQLLNLASVMLMNPHLLILDEPSSQLDPIAAREFLENVKKINEEFGTTIIITEHNLEDVYGYADRVVLMEDRTIKKDLSPAEMAKYLSENEHEGMYKALPTPSRIYGSILRGKCPLSIVEGRQWFSEMAAGKKLSPIELEEKVRPEEKAIELEEVWFQYEKGGNPILRNTSFTVRKGEFASIMGGNGSGKTTALSVISQRAKYTLGTVRIMGKDLKTYKGASLFDHLMAYLPQNPQAIFVSDNLLSDLMEVPLSQGTTKDEAESRAREMAGYVGIPYLLDRHPYDLSGGEMQKAALAKILLLEPKILLLDEPTKGMDALSKEKLGKILRGEIAKGMTILMVTHDLEFCARYSDHCMMFFDGGIVSEGTPKKFFSENSFYTTAASRMTRHVVSGVITSEEGENICRTYL